mmetsp:Transcript_95618/g.270373  ORF Transcript_95618/g.270373 Transcript_95618/m.270373 type:complete len:465 (+) Transcript_95618:736-2130(+)
MRRLRIDALCNLLLQTAEDELHAPFRARAPMLVSVHECHYELLHLRAEIHLVWVLKPDVALGRLTEYHARAGAAERRMPREQEVEHGACAKYVNLFSIGVRGRDHLWRHIPRRATPRLHGLLVRPIRRNPKVSENCTVVCGQQDVLRLHVPVHHPTAVDMGKRGEDLPSEHPGPVFAVHAILVHVIKQVPTAEVRDKHISYRTSVPHAAHVVPRGDKNAIKTRSVGVALCSGKQGHLIVHLGRLLHLVGRIQAHYLRSDVVQTISGISRAPNKNAGTSSIGNGLLAKLVTVVQARPEGAQGTHSMQGRLQCCMPSVDDHKPHRASDVAMGHRKYLVRHIPHRHCHDRSPLGPLGCMRRLCEEQRHLLNLRPSARTADQQAALPSGDRGECAAACLAKAGECLLGHSMEHLHSLHTGLGVQHGQRHRPWCLRASSKMLSMEQHPNRQARTTAAGTCGTYPNKRAA